MSSPNPARSRGIDVVGDLPSEDLPTLIYIMGTARSGTTILEVLLGNNPGVTNVGELSHIFRDGFLADGECACGRRVSRCSLWARVRRIAGIGGEDAEDARRLSRAVEWHHGFPRHLLGLFGRRTLSRYRAVQARLLNALFEATGDPVLVDSSIYPGRAVALSRAFPGRVRVLCLTRSPTGLLEAFGKEHEEEQAPKSPAGVVLYYGYVGTCLKLAERLLPEPVLRLSFEALRRDPEATLRAIEEWSGLDLSASRDLLARDEKFEVGHIVTGNRLRKEGRVRFRKGLDPPETRGGVVGLAASVMEFYGRLIGLE